MTDESERQQTLKAYTILVTSYMLGLIRLIDAQTVAYRAQTALSRLHQPDLSTQTTNDAFEEVLKPLRRITYPQYDAFGYLTGLSYLVYGTTLLDSFLSDTTKFLFLRFPGAMGKDHSIRLDSVIAATSREELISIAANKKTREIGYLPVLARVEFLNQTFGLKIKLDDSTVEGLQHYSDLRNVIVHDQSVFDVDLKPGGRLEIRQKTCARHPTVLRHSDQNRAERAYRQVVALVFEAVVTHVFKAEVPAEVVLLATALKRSPTPPSEDGSVVGSGDDN